MIHTPGPVYRDGRGGERDILAASYRNSMQLLKKNGLHSIAFPAISTGIYGYPKEEACEVAVTTVLDFMLQEHYNAHVVFVLYDRENYDLYCSFIGSLKQ